LRSAM